MNVKKGGWGRGGVRWGKVGVQCGEVGKGLGGWEVGRWGKKGGGTGKRKGCPSWVVLPPGSDGLSCVARKKVGTP